MFAKVRKILKLSLGAVVVLYPVLIFLSIVIFDVSANHLAFFIIIFAAIYLFINISQKERRHVPSTYISPVLLCLIGIAGSLLDSPLLLKLYPSLAGKTKEIIKLYPLLTNAAWIVVFGMSLIFPPPFVLQIAALFEKTIKITAVEIKLKQFCHKATIIWCLFFVVDTMIAWLTIFGPLVSGKNERFSDTIWGIYNGAITYIIMGIIFLIQLIAIKKIIKKGCKGTIDES